MNIKIRKIKRISSEISPDEIFMDSSNIPGFNDQQFEGRIEKPISKYSILFLGLFFLLVGISYTVKTFNLQVAKGDTYREISEKNHLKTTPIFADRGVIYDRNNVELAWNEKNESGSFSLRKYIDKNGFSHVLGYVSQPKMDSSGNYWQEDVFGKDGIEKMYNERLNGENGLKIIETDVSKKIKSESNIQPAKDGENVTLSIDAGVQAKLFDEIKALAEKSGFVGGAGIIMDVNNGEVIALTSYPEYSSNVMSARKDHDTINYYLTSDRKLFLNRIVTGVYTPGSTVKPFMSIAALNEKIISPNKQILSTGSISIPNPYFPDKPTVFKDWKAHGWVDMKRAIAVSSDVYFYAIGGGYQDQKGMGISNIEKYARVFGFGKKTGIDLFGESIGNIPNPEWKAKNFNGEEWRIGNTYHTSIGQYGFQVTPAQMTRYAGALANGGKLMTPHMIKGDEKFENKYDQIDINPEYFNIVKEGMRGSVTEGTAKGLDVSYVKVGGKTGTAELGVHKEYVNSWTIGFFPYDKPKYAYVVVMEKGPRANTVGATFVMRQLFDWMNQNTPEYFKAS